MTIKTLPLISVIVVVYNASNTLKNSLQSVVDQSYSNIELIIIDGGSTDGSIDIITSFKNKIALFITEKDNGIYDAMNKGLRHATGDWVYFLGADDLLLTPTIIEEVVEYFSNPDEVYYGNTYLKTRNRIYNGKVNLLRLCLCNISHQAIFYPRSIYSLKEYNTNYKYAADHVYNLELYASSREKFVYIPTLISVYNDQGRSSTNIDHTYDKDIVKIMRRNFGLLVSWYVWLRRKVAKFKKSLLK